MIVSVHLKERFAWYTSPMKKTILFFMLMFLFFGEFFPVSAQPRPRRPMMQGAPDRGMNFNGRKLPNRNENFSVIGLKIEESGEFLKISIFFNEPVDSNSVEARHIFIDEKPLPPQTEFLFSKNRHMTRFTVPKQTDDFSLKITDLRSFDGKLINPTEIKNLEANSFCKYSRETCAWQKSSL